MEHYIDISVLPDSEFETTVLLNAIYTKLHKALYDMAATDIGVSFPKSNIILGNLLRIHGKKEILFALMALKWIGGMSGYCEISQITLVPHNSKFRTVSRRQATMSRSKLGRLIKRGSITEDEIKRYKSKMFSKSLDNPYVELVSGSNGQKHRRYIEFGALIDRPVPGKFDQFGLSKMATVPWFD